MLIAAFRSMGIEKSPLSHSAVQQWISSSVRPLHEMEALAIETSISLTWEDGKSE